jgi:hypothetical protein
MLAQIVPGQERSRSEMPRQQIKTMTFLMFCNGFGGIIAIREEKLRMSLAELFFYGSLIRQSRLDCNIYRNSGMSLLNAGFVDVGLVEMCIRI